MIKITFEKFLYYLINSNKIIQGEHLVANYLCYKSDYMSK